MLTAALNMLLILAIGSGLSEARPIDKYNDSARTATPSSYKNDPHVTSGNAPGTTVV